MTSFKPSFSVALWLPLSIFMFFSICAFGQTLPEANLIKDINVGSASSSPNNFISLNGKTYFKATPVTGSLSKIMVTDGTEVGTTVAGFSPTNVSLFSDMVLFNNQIYWLAEQAGSITLWKTADGNSATFVDTIAVAKADTTYNLNNNFNTKPFVANNNLVLHYVKHYAPFSYDTDLHYYAYSNGLKGGTRNVGLGEKRYIGTVTPSNSSTKFVGSNNIFFINLIENFSNGYYTVELKSNFNNNPIVSNSYPINQPAPVGKNIIGLGVINDNFIGVINDTLYSITATGQKTLLKTGCTNIQLIEQLNNTIYFNINYKDIFKTNGTEPGTAQLITSTVPLTVKIKINDTLYVASSNNENTYEVWKIDNSRSDFQRILQVTGPKLGIFTYAVNNQLFMGNVSGTKTTLYKPDFVNQKLKMIGQVDRLSQLGAIQSGNLLMASGDNDQVTAVNINAKGAELRSLNLNPSISTFPCASDTTRPVFNTCPTNLITFTKFNLSPTWCYFEPIPRPDASDLCGTVFTDVSAVKGQFLPESQWNNGQPSYTYCTLGYDTITYTVRDLLFNVSKCTFRVNIIAPDPCSSDITPPTFARCPTDTIINANQPTIVNWTTPAVSDNCGIPSLGVNYTSGSTFPMGVTRVIYTATDVANNTAVCSFNVTVSNPTNPVNCASNAQSPWNEWIKEVKIDTFVNVSEKVRSDRYAVGYSDFKDKIIPLKRGDVYLLGLIAGISFPTYDTNLFYNAWIDFNGNKIFEDDEKILGGGANNIGAGGTFYIPLTAKIGNTVLRISLKKDGLPSPCGTFAAGEVEDYTINILANNNCDTDTTPPFYYNCPENITLTTTGTTAVATWVTPTATDNCGTPSVLSDYQSGFAFPLGTSVVTYTFADAKANKRTCNFNVNVTNSNPCLNDAIPPVLSNCPTNISLTTTGTTAIATWTAPTATDNCSTPSVLSNYNLGFAFPIGLTTVTYTATDAKGNKSTCSFTITVTKQTISTCLNPLTDIVGGVGNITVSNISTAASIVQIFNSSWTSIYNQQLTGNTVIIPNIPAGKYIVKVLVLKEGGVWPNICVETNYDVIVLGANNTCDTDVKPPVISGCPSNITVTSSNPTSVSWNVPTATDECGTPSVSSNFNQSSILPIGITKIIYTATDLKGNKATCSFDVTISKSLCDSDKIKPIIYNCPSDVTVITRDSFAIATWTPPTATDNCALKSLIGSKISGQVFPLGVNSVIYSALDSSNNLSTCNFFVNIVKEVINTGGDICANPIANVIGGQGRITINGITTNSALIQIFTSTWQSVAYYEATTSSYVFTNIPNGQYIVKVTVLGVGRKWPAICILQVDNVMVGAGTDPCATDGTPPTFTNCPTNISLTTTGTTSIATWTAPTATDNCGTPSVLSNYNSGFAFPLGTTAVTYTATDAKANKATCSFNVVVAQSIGCRQRDSLVLMDVYNNMGGGNWISNNWDITKPIDTWYGVNLNANGCVVDLGLWLAIGNIRPSIGNLSELVNLHFNGFATITGTLPSELSNLKKLKLLEVNGNKLTGSIPASFGTMTNLEDLRLQDNQLTGAIPTELGNLKKLKLLLINNNKLSGEIPSSLGTLDSMYGLFFSNNQLTGKIPNSFGSLKSLDLLDLRNNLLSDTLPRSLVLMPKLTRLYLSNNLLSGCIPSEYKTLCGKDVDLSNNPNLLGGGDWAAFCSSSTGICPTITNDLELSMSANPSVFKKWTTINTTVSLKNIGNQAFTNIEVNVPAPKGTSAGGTGLPTVGTWQPYCSGGVLCYKWTIPSLAANATATLTIPLFVLNVDTAIVATAKLLTSTPVDNNAANNTATVSIAPAPTQQIQALSIRKPTQYIPVIIQKISPNPTDGDVYIDVESLDERDMRFEFFNAQGQNVYNEMQHLKKGLNQLYFNITDREAGLYFVKPETSGGRNVPVKFVKL
jgi:hypothetical protein